LGFKSDCITGLGILVPKKLEIIATACEQHPFWQSPYAPFIKIHIQMRWKKQSTKQLIPSAIVGQRRNTQGNGQNDFAKPLM
jgi:hypothetical protein